MDTSNKNNSETKHGKCFIVGISGATNAGKTTLSAQLIKQNPLSHHFIMDEYFKETDELPYVEEFQNQNWDIISAVNMDQVLEDLLKLKNECENEKGIHLIIVEGIFIFNYAALLPYFNLKYYMTITKDECEKRRKIRVYDPPDTPVYFDKCIWPMHLHYAEEIQKITNMKFLSGLLDKDYIFKTVNNEINFHLQKLNGQVL